MDASRNRNRQADVPCSTAQQPKARVYSRSRMEGSDINRARRSRRDTGLSRAATNASHRFWDSTNSLWSAKMSAAFSCALESTKSVRFCPFIRAQRSRKDFVSFDVRKSIRQFLVAAIGDMAAYLFVGGEKATAATACNPYVQCTHNKDRCQLASWTATGFSRRALRAPRHANLSLAY